MKDNPYLLTPTKLKDSTYPYLKAGWSPASLTPTLLANRRLGNVGIKKDKRKNWQIYRDIQSVKYEKEYRSLTNKQKKQWEPYLAGFWEGEGSMTVSFKEHSTCKFGFYIDPEVSLTQNVDGIHLLFWAKCYFRTGRVHLKSRSNNVWVYSMSNRRSILESFIPFFEKHMLAWTGKDKTFKIFKDIVCRLEKNEHQT
jgi:hypothetical protein